MLMCCEVRLMYKITQTRASIVILHAIRCVDCCAGMLLINVTIGTSKKRAFVGLGRNSLILELGLRFHFTLT